uniref:Uncharacterized protein n=1 Tax=Meloidogyne enterolobii TaxID=390850 RepID=A0A6V7U649_MELEN|nr:unnamed protein product [Meloidogyne enterolobii]
MLLEKKEGISKLICQFFVFGILFGVVCSISACSCIFRSRHFNNSQRIFNGINTLEEANLNRLKQIKEPFSLDQPYYLKIDEKGLFYACPLNNKEEIPKLPNYLEACKMPTTTNWALNDIKASPV